MLLSGRLSGRGRPQRGTAVAPPLVCVVVGSWRHGGESTIDVVAGVRPRRRRSVPPSRAVAVARPGRLAAAGAGRRWQRELYRILG